MALYSNHVSEKRLTSRLLAYWENIKDASEDMPDFRKFKSDAISDMWQNCMVLEVSGTEEKPFYTYINVGSAVAEAYGKNPKGERFNSNLKNVPGATMFSKLDEALRDRKFLLDEGSFVNDKNKITKYRGCLMPFRNSGNKVSHIVIGISWRTF